MLFNPNWTKKSEDVHSLSSLIRWLKTKDPEESYEYTSSRNCLLAQYYRAKGYSKAMVDPECVRLSVFKWQDLPEHFNAIAREGEETFGAALERAKAARWI